MSLRANAVTYAGAIVGGLALPAVYLLNNEAINRFLMPPSPERESLYDLDKIFQSVGISMGAAAVGAVAGLVLGYTVNKAITRIEESRFFQNLFQHTPSNLKIRPSLGHRHNLSH